MARGALSTALLVRGERKEEHMPEGTLNPSNRKEFNRQLIEEFRANGGKVTGQFANRPLLLLTSTGAKSGRPYTTPVVYTTDGDRLVVIASKGGAPSNPDWYYKGELRRVLDDRPRVRVAQPLRLRDLLKRWILG